MVPKTDSNNSASPLKPSWPIVAVGLTIAGMLTWLGWIVTRPDVGSPDER